MRFVGGHKIVYANNLCNSSQLVSAIANYGIYDGRYDAFLGHNTMFCSSKFNVNVSDKGSGEVNVRCAVYRYVERKVEEHQMQVAGFLQSYCLYVMII